MAESTKRAAGAAQDAANDCRTAAEEAKREAEDLGALPSIPMQTTIIKVPLCTTD